MIKELILAWQNPHNRAWIPVGRLKYHNNRYIFQYTIGAQHTKGFAPFVKMSDVTKLYESEDLLPVFKNRLFQKSRPEYGDFLDWIDLKADSATHLNELARSGGIRATDSLQLFPVPQKMAEKYEVYFFSNGIRYLDAGGIDRINSLSSGSRLCLMKDIQNKFDERALVLRVEEPYAITGYCPNLLVGDFNKLIEINGSDAVKVSVVKINKDSPLQFKLLCAMSTSWPGGFTPFDDDIFQPATKTAS